MLGSTVGEWLLDEPQDGKLCEIRRFQRHLYLLDLEDPSAACWSPLVTLEKDFVLRLKPEVVCPLE
jgi:hypothetical protein